MSMLYKYAEMKSGYKTIVSQNNSQLKYLEFGLLYLPEKDHTYYGKTRNWESVLSIFSGTCSIDIESPLKKTDFEDVGERKDVFSGRPTMVYIPRNSEYKIRSKTALDAGVSSALCDIDYHPTLVTPKETIERNIGALNWTRKVYTSIGDNVKAQRLLVGETINPPGNWSSSPPHKHDTKTIEESPLEEIYFYKVKPKQGYGLQRIYTDKKIRDPIDAVYVVENNDTVILPRGYHPVVAAPGYQLYYLWVLAGEERRYGSWTDDPKHSWLRECESIVNNLFNTNR